MSAPAPNIRQDASSSTDSDAANILDLNDEEGWEDAEPEDEQQTIVSLLDNETFPDVTSMLVHCKNKYGFDFLHIRDKFALDFYGCIKLVNYIRSKIKRGQAVSSNISKSLFEADIYLMPVLEDDALLFSLDDLPDTSINQDAANCDSIPVNETAELLSRVAKVEEELQKTKNQFLDYRETVARTLDERWNDSFPSTSTSGLLLTEEKRDDDTHYFGSYSYNDIHETMLKDTVRTDAYRDFIYNHKHLFVGKTVLDVGCGTGILSMFCAKAGAAQVIAVDNSAIIDKARENIFNNGFSNKIVCLRGKVEEVTLPVENVDIIVSEWMGYCLLYEAMLDSVIWARDKYLKRTGLMVPSHMNMWIAPLSDPDYVMDHFAFWRDVYGFDMKAMQAGIYDDTQVLYMPVRSLCGNPFPFLQLDLYSTTVKDLTFKREWNITLAKDIDALDGFLVWFDAYFMPSRDDKVPMSAKAEEWNKQQSKGVAFTTGPFGRETHWRQGAFFVDNNKVRHNLKEGEKIDGNLEYRVPIENSRALDISIFWTAELAPNLKSQSWKMK